ncbi:class I SAM-dependent methyltransferase, partial [Patescibacteria group bacterium]
MKDDYSEFYDPELVAVYNTVCVLDGYEQFYFRLAKEVKAKTIVDIGCGTGLITCALAKQGYTTIGVEPSKLMLDVARTSPYGDKVQWIEGYASSLQAFNADLAIMTAHVAQFLLEKKELKATLNAIHTALRPGGYLAFESRNPAVSPWVTKKKQDSKDWYAPDFR